MNKLNGSFTVEKGKKITLSMKCATVNEFALNWLNIYNVARENKEAFLKCELFSNDDIVVLTNLTEGKKVKEWLEKFGPIRIEDVKYRMLDFEGNYEHDTDYDIIEK